MNEEEHKKIIAVDFDGTLCENRFPDIGNPNFSVIEYIKRQKSIGAQIILWTCREGEYLQNALAWCNSYGIEFDAVNDDVQQTKDSFIDCGRKVYADEYIDDKAIPVMFFKREVRDSIRSVFSHK